MAKNVCIQRMVPKHLAYGIALIDEYNHGQRAHRVPSWRGSWEASIQGAARARGTRRGRPTGRPLSPLVPVTTDEA
jgi:hypothetical protein